MGAAPSGIPGWPDLACSTASTARKRMVSTTRGAPEGMFGSPLRVGRPADRHKVDGTLSRRHAVEQADLGVDIGKELSGSYSPPPSYFAEPHQRRSIERWPVTRFAPLKYVTDGEMRVLDYNL